MYAGRGRMLQEVDTPEENDLYISEDDQEINVKMEEERLSSEPILEEKPDCTPSLIGYPFIKQLE